MQNNILEAIQAILVRESKETAVFTPLPVFKEGKFNWLQRLLKHDRNDNKLYTLKDYPSCWTYVTIMYRILNYTIYIHSCNYKIAD